MLAFLLVLLLLCFNHSTMSPSSVEGHPILDRMVRSFHSTEEFCAGWEGWLEGACSAKVKFEVGMPFALPFCVQNGMGFWFWWTRVVSNALGLGIMMVGWMSSPGIIIFVAWFMWICFTKGSSILWGFSVFILFRKVELLSMIRRVGTAVG